MILAVFMRLHIICAFILCILLREGAAVKCYICSWSPHDNRSDTCTRRNFIPEYSLIHDCEKGCEVVSMKDGNGQMEMFYRNCYTKSDNGYVIDRRHTGVNEEEVYKCNWKLCNAATNAVASQNVLILFIATGWYTLNYCP